MNFDSIILEFLAKLTILSLILQVALFAMKGRSASARHSVIRFGFGAFLLLPILKFGLPAWSVPGWIQGVDPVRIITPTGVNVGSLLVAIWLAGFLVTVSRMLVGLLSLVGKGSGLTDETSLSLSGRVRSILGDRNIQVRLDNGSTQPMTWGHLHPTILLPTDADTWNDRRLNAILAHEIAHVERWDWLNALFANFISAIYWFHPLVWLAAKRFAAESERAADDRALTVGCAPIDYAFHLLETAKSYRDSRRVPGVAMAKASPLKTRLSGILSKHCPRKPLSKSSAFSLAAAFGIFAAIVATATSSRLAPMPAPVAHRITPLPLVLIAVHHARSAKKTVIEPRKRIVAVRCVVPPTGRIHRPSKPVEQSGWLAASLLPSRPSSKPKTKFYKNENSVCKDMMASMDLEAAQQEVEASFDSAAKAIATQSVKSDRTEDQTISKTEMRSQLKSLKIAFDEVKKTMSSSVRDARRGPLKDFDIDIPEINVNETGVKIQIPAIHVHVPGAKLRISKSGGQLHPEMDHESDTNSGTPNE